MTQQLHSEELQETGAFEPTGQQAAGQYQQTPPNQQGSQHPQNVQPQQGEQYGQQIQSQQNGQPQQSGHRQQSGQPQQSTQSQQTGQSQQPSQFQQSMAGQGMGGQQRGGQRFKTRNSLPEDVRVATCQKLNQVLADTTDLRTQVTYAHWNVKGMNFYQFHELFEELAEVLAEHEDLIAERITALGGQARGTARQAAGKSRIPEIPAATTQGRGFVQQLASRIADFDTSLYHDIRAAEEYDDLDTADMLNEISREVSHYLWLLEAHLQGHPQGQVWSGGQGQFQSPQH